MGDPGAVEASVLAGLARMTALDQGFRATLAQMALEMARAYDQYISDGGIELPKLARLNMELRQTLAALVGTGNDDDGGEAERLGTPVWGVPAAVRDAEVSGAADVGSAAYGGGRKAGSAVDAAPATHR